MHEIQPSTFEFLKKLSANNHKEWFTANKALYDQAHHNMINFMDSLITEMNKVDRIETPSGKRALFRIYRDVRFSKEKTPYKTHFGGRMSRATQWLRGGHYVHIEPGNSYIAGGFFNPNAADLKLIRDELSYNAQPLRDILNDADFKKYWGTFEGDAVKTAPRGFDKEHPALDLIRFKQFHLSHTFTDEEVLSENFIFEIVKAFLIIRPFFDYMSEILTRHIEG